jgi:hypothetical protein
MPGMFQTRPLQTDIGSEYCFDLAKYWLRSCLEAHQLSCPKIETLLPVRVIDVGLLGESSAFLHVSKGQRGQWLTLSHCWGENVPARTTMASIGKISDGIEISSLPSTFQDAILITRKLGYRYLWIDSLCIVQDSSHDWSRESIKMSEIYSNAVLCIAASAATDPHQGIFESANKELGQDSAPGFENRPKLIPLVGRSAKLGKHSTIYARVFCGYYPGDDESVLQKRAWAYQRGGFVAASIMLH